jgi:hypothetical protein
MKGSAGDAMVLLSSKRRNESETHYQELDKGIWEWEDIGRWKLECRYVFVLVLLVDYTAQYSFFLKFQCLNL